MLKQSVTALVYYLQEMLMFLLGLFIFLSFIGEEMSMGSYYSWFAFYFVVGVPFLLIVRDRAKNPQILSYILPVTIGLVGFLLWDFHLGLLIVLSIFPFLRLWPLLKLTLEAEYLLKRFTIFIGVLIAGYLFLKLMSSDIDQGVMLIYLWIQFTVLILGLLCSSYIKNKKETSTGLWEWLKNQTLLLYLGVGFTILAVAGSFLLPGIQFILKKIPEGLSWLFTSGPVRAFLSWLMPHDRSFLPKRDIIYQLPDIEYEIGEDREVEQISVDWINSIMMVLGILFMILVFVCLVLVVIYFLRKRNTFNVDQARGERGSTERVNRQPKSSSWLGKKTNWAQDEIRRNYQKLLVYAQQKGEPITAQQTVRTWSQCFQGDEQAQQVWNRINSIYEQRRYSNEPIGLAAVESFKQEINQAKKEINRFYKERKKEQKQQQKEKKNRKGNHSSKST